MKNLTDCKKIKEDNEECTEKVEKRYVYIIRGGRWCKIGVSKNPIDRLKQLDSTLLPFNPEVVAMVKVNNALEIESEIHNTYKSKRIRGEWFILNEEDVEQIISRYSFDKQGDHLVGLTSEVNEYLDIVESVESEKLKDLRALNNEIEQHQAGIIRLIISLIDLRVKGIDLATLIKIIPVEHYKEFFTIDVDKLERLVEALKEHYKN